MFNATMTKIALYLNNYFTSKYMNVMKRKLCLAKVGVWMMASTLLFSSCATIVSRSSYPLNISSEPQGAKVVITNKDGSEVFSGTTPATVKLRASRGFFAKELYTLRFTLANYEAKSVTVSATLDGWYFGNILVGGLIGMLIVDPATGAMWKLDTAYVNVTLTPYSSYTSGLTVMDINHIPDSWKEHLIRLDN
jgi:hypothetical protein